MAVDKPVVQFSLAQIRKDAPKVEVLKVALSGSKIITFPDIMAMDSEESEILLTRLESRTEKNWSILADWLSADDCAALRSEKLSLADLTRLLRQAGQYYEDQYGDLKNGDASANS